MKNKIRLKVGVTALGVMLLFLNCSTYQLRKPTAANPNPGAVGFCLVYHEKVLIGERLAPVYGLNYVENLGNSRYANVYLKNETNDQEQDELKYNNHCFLVTGLKPGVTYSLDLMKTVYAEGRTTVYLTAQLNPEMTQQVLPIVAYAGRINFLGVYVAESVVVEKGSLFVADKKAAVIMDGVKVLEPIIFDAGVKSAVYENYEHDKGGAEKNFLESVVKSEKDGYWRTIAANRLSQLGVKPK